MKREMKETLEMCYRRNCTKGGMIMTDDYWKNTEPCTSIEQLQEEQAALVEDLVHKADLLRVATKALEDIRATCISSPYWHNQISHAPAHLQNVARALLRHHKIATDAQKKIEEMTRAILKT
jgi:hypothetical protein